MIKESKKIVPKVWGYEVWLVNRPEYCGKLLMLNKDATCSYHRHWDKTETFFCIEGQAILTVEGKEYDLNPMARAKTILPGEFHKFKGVGKTCILEVSTHHDDADVERLEQSIKGKASWRL